MHQGNWTACQSQPAEPASPFLDSAGPGWAYNLHVWQVPGGADDAGRGPHFENYYPKGSLLKAGSYSEMTSAYPVTHKETAEEFV